MWSTSTKRGEISISMRNKRLKLNRVNRTNQTSHSQENYNDGLHFFLPSLSRCRLECGGYLVNPITCDYY